MTDPTDTINPSAQRIWFSYTNWRGEVRVRSATPISLWFGTLEWYRNPQWFMRAYDHDKQAEREFALTDCDFDILEKDG